eukprot:TRINITY_DN48477_c0_g1_i1.p1 TRINITY_DN48477_c0_g1~~TRINITY_DN48477_c0_g1_i1.p1  ORF type:complete len:209 (+),score=18.39 TRINITY_DN48477_c0_g1_i1:38-628(+)
MDGDPSSSTDSRQNAEPVTGIVMEDDGCEGLERVEGLRLWCVREAIVLVVVTIVCSIFVIRAALCGLVAALLTLRWTVTKPAFELGAQFDGCCSRHNILTLSLIFSSLNILLLPLPLYTSITSGETAVTPAFVTILSLTVLSNFANMLVCWQMVKTLKKYNMVYTPPIIAGAVVRHGLEPQHSLQSNGPGSGAESL